MNKSKVITYLKNPYALAGLIFIIACFVRFYRLTYYSMTGDEIFTIRHTLYPFYMMMWRVINVTIPDAEIAPPFYLIVLYGWLKVLGHDVFMGRLFSALLGIGTVVLVYFLSKEVFSDRERLWSIAILALHPFHIWYSQELRMYALITFLVAASALYHLKYIQSLNKKFLLFYLFFTILAVYTQYYFMFVLLAQNLFTAIYVIFYNRKDLREIIKYWLIAQVLIVLAFIPYIKPLQNDLQVLGSFKFEYVFSISSIPFAFLKLGFYAVGTYVFSHLWLYTVLSVIAVLILVGIIKVWKNEGVFPYRILYLILLILIPVGFTLSIAFIKRQTFRPHALVLLVPLVAILFATGLSAWKDFIRRILGFSLLSGFVYILLTLNYSEDYTKPKFKPASEFIAKHFSRDIFIINLPWLLPCPADLPGSYHAWIYYLPDYPNIFMPKGDVPDDVYQKTKGIVKNRDTFLIAFHYIRFAKPYLDEVFSRLDNDFEMKNRWVFASKIDDFDVIVIEYKRRK